jgi:hypothetical protein
MEEATLKIELIDKIERADFKQLQEIYGLLTNYFNSQDATGEWDRLSDYRKERIARSIEQANAGLYESAKDVSARIRKKYGLNG